MTSTIFKGQKHASAQDKRLRLRGEDVTLRKQKVMEAPPEIAVKRLICAWHHVPDNKGEVLQ
ncbi:hypothetical protein [Mailhella sp.]|uniref:hypothetical protein n=1 Tax=Mailhella sp. TaxID=1981029 RepID=UPI003AB89634